MPSSLFDALVRHCEDLPGADEPEFVTGSLDLPALTVVLESVPDLRDR